MPVDFYSSARFRGAILLDERASAPSNPSSGQMWLYPRTNNRLYVKDDTGSEYEIARVPPSIIPAQVNEAIGDYGGTPSTGSWVSNAAVTNWLSPITITVPPSGELDVTIGANLRSSTSTFWLSYQVSGAASYAIGTYGFQFGVKGGSPDGTRACSNRRFQGLPPGGTVTFTPYVYRFGGTISMDKGILQVCPVYYPGDV